MSVTKLLSEYTHVHQEKDDGEIQAECLFKENHADGSGKKSLWVNPKKNTYHCWSCKQTGTVLGLLTNTLNVDYYTAIELIGYNPLENIGEVAYEDRFKKSDKVKVVECELDHILSIRPPKWILDRFGAELCRKHMIGTVESKSGVVTTFPVVWDKKIVGVAYRGDINGEKIMWFNKGFDKGQYLYNQPNNKAYLTLVEGQTDTLQTEKNGVQNVSAILGSYLTKAQLNIIKRLDELEEVNLAFDNDSAGILCTIITGEILEQYVDSIKVNVLPIMDDPGATSKKDWDKAMRERVGFPEYKVRMQIALGREYEHLYYRAEKSIKKWHEK